MISFVWELGLALPSGTGGSENYTIGHARELNRRGIAAQVVTVAAGRTDGRDQFESIPFQSLESLHDVSELDGTVVFVTDFPEVRTLNGAYQMLHTPPSSFEGDRRKVTNRMRHRSLIAPSRFGARLWSDFLGVDVDDMSVVYPFAEPCFARQARPLRDRGEVRILYAGRLSPEKGIYTFLEMLHSDRIVAEAGMNFTATTAGIDKPQGKIIHAMLDARPGLSLIPAARTPSAVASLMANYDIVLMPSNAQYWHEMFGMVSVEAQHVGCRVVASDDGGLPETDCGSVTYVAPDNSDALARGIQRAVGLGPTSLIERRHAATQFTVRQSVDQLLSALEHPSIKSLPVLHLEKATGGDPHVDGAAATAIRTEVGQHAVATRSAGS